MEANERSSGGSSFVRLVTPFIYSGFTKGSFAGSGSTCSQRTHTHTISLPYTHTQTRSGSIHTSGMAGPLLLGADWGLRIFGLIRPASNMLCSHATYSADKRKRVRHNPRHDETHTRVSGDGGGGGGGCFSQQVNRRRVCVTLCERTIWFTVLIRIHTVEEGSKRSRF